MLGNIIRDLYPYMLKVQYDGTETRFFNALSPIGSAKMPTESQQVKSLTGGIELDYVFDAFFSNISIQVFIIIAFPGLEQAVVSQI